MKNNTTKASVSIFHFIFFLRRTRAFQLLKGVTSQSTARKRKEQWEREREKSLDFFCRYFIPLTIYHQWQNYSYANRSPCTINKMENEKKKKENEDLHSPKRPCQSARMRRTNSLVTSFFLFSSSFTVVSCAQQEASSCVSIKGKEEEEKEKRTDKQRKRRKNEIF